MRLLIGSTERFVHNGAWRIVSMGNGTAMVQPIMSLEKFPMVVIEIGRLGYGSEFGVAIYAVPTAIEPARQAEWSFRWRWVAVTYRDLKVLGWLWWSPIVPIWMHGFSPEWTGRHREICGFEIRLGGRRWRRWLPESAWI